MLAVGYLLRLLKECWSWYDPGPRNFPVTFCHVLYYPNLGSRDRVVEPFFVFVEFVEKPKILPLLVTEGIFPGPGVF